MLFAQGVLKLINISAWIKDYKKALNLTFGNRVWFMGLQGSYARGEATIASDIDIVLILDKISADDIKIYNDMLDSLPNRNLVCGFLSGKEEILNWEPSDLFHLYYDTKPIIGNLDELLLKINAESIEKAIKIGVCNIYHGCVHNMLYTKDENILKSLYKSAVFVVQTICFKQTNKYISKQAELAKFVSENEKAIVETFIDLKANRKVEFKAMSELLFNWSKNWIDAL